jgi:transposase
VRNELRNKWGVARVVTSTTIRGQKLGPTPPPLDASIHFFPYYLLLHLRIVSSKMDSQRVFGTEISGNRQRFGHLKPEVRAAITASIEAGQSATHVAKVFAVSRRTVNRTVQRFRQRHTFTTAPRSGRPRKLSPREERYLVRLVRRFPKSSYKKLVNLHGATVSARTLRRVLKRHNLKKWLSKRRPKLREDDARERLKFARFWRGREEELATVGEASETAKTTN